jgi:hypothetical protein
MIPHVDIVVCMDTEGPCADPGNPELLATWEAVDGAMDKLFSPGFRERRPDPAGGVLKFGWFFLTWTGFRTNPRDRALGYHAVRDHYVERWGEAISAYGDEHCWHYHHPPASGIGNEWGLDWDASDEHDAIVSRQILERNWFPTCFRAGGTILTPESSRWVDAWFPFDYSNRAPVKLDGLVDWSPGVAEWTLYHPSPEDFRRPGPGRRRMARTLDLATWAHTLGEEDVAQAFELARLGEPAVLACFEHDYRDIAERLDEFRAMVARVAERYPDVPWRYAAPVEAARRFLDVPAPPRLELDAAVIDGDVEIRSSAPIFQSYPWLAIRVGDTVSHVEDGIVRIDETTWRWSAGDVAWDELGVGASTDLGSPATARIGPDDGPGRLFLRSRTERSPVQPRSLWEHSKYYVELSLARAAGDAEEMDAVRQTLALLGSKLESGMSLLDVGSAAGHLQRSLPEGIEYHGIDPATRGIAIGRAYGSRAGLPAERLRALEIDDLPPDESYDAVVCLSTLAYLPMFHRPLEAMARAARRWLIVRSSFGDETEIRYIPDPLLEEGFQGLRTYLNIYGRAEVQSFLEQEGFRVTWVEDERQRDRFGGEPEVVGGIELPYEFLVAERVAPPPTDEAVLGSLLPVAREWLERRAGN